MSCKVEYMWFESSCVFFDVVVLVDWVDCMNVVWILIVFLMFVEFWVKECDRRYGS